MSLTIELSPQEEQGLREEAARQGLPPEDLVLRAVKHLIPVQNEDAIRALEAVYHDGDEEEQRETLDYLKRALDEDRLPIGNCFDEPVSRVRFSARLGWRQRLALDPTLIG